MTKTIEHEFQLKPGQPYIQLNNLLQVLQLAQTGGHAKLIIQNGEIIVNDEIETRIRKKLVVSDVIIAGNHRITIA